MNRISAMVSALAVGGGLSLCDLCGVLPWSVAAASARPRLVGAAHAATFPTASAEFVASREAATVAPAVITKTVTLKVEGMTCGSCVFGVRKVLTRLR